MEMMPAQATGSSPSAGDSAEKSFRMSLWCVALLLGFANAWATKDHIVNDGMSYIEIGRDAIAGDWQGLLNGYWSPLYSLLQGATLALLRTTPYQEFRVAHLVSFLIYIVSLACFDFFWRTLGEFNRTEFGGIAVGLFSHERAWRVLGYFLFLWASLELISLSIVPDLAVAAIVFLVAAILVRIRCRRNGWRTFALLGMVLGVGYLVKFPMFPMAFVFLGVGGLAVGNLRRAVSGGLVGLVVFLAVSAPYLVALSLSKGRLTYGDAPRINYAWHVNGVENPHWQGEPPGSGVPLHPSREIFRAPEVFEFATPIQGTYPIWKNPPYWNEGLKVHIDLHDQLRALVNCAFTYAGLLRSRLDVMFAILLILLLGREWFRAEEIAAGWFIFVPGLAGLIMYALIYVEPRYVAAFIVLLLAGIFSSLRLSDSSLSRELLFAIALALSITIGVSVARITFDNFRRDDPDSVQAQGKIAQGLQRLGIHRGDRVACVGYQMLWARLAGVRIVADIPAAEVSREPSFWSVSPSVRAQVEQILARYGVRAIVAAPWGLSVNPVGPGMRSGELTAFGWRELGNTGYWVRILPPQN